jgi:predicted membrane protein DUF2232
MVQIILIGITAGAAAALLFTSVISGSALSLLLISLTPLPILIASVGWSYVAGLIAAVVAAAALAVTVSGPLALAFLVSVGLSSSWLGYLALLARPAAPPEDLEWYPVGRLVVWAALIATVAVTISLLTIGFDAETIHGGLARAIEQIMRMETGTPADAPLDLPSTGDPKRIVRLLAIVFPPMLAALATVSNLLQLWLAARIVMVSGRLKRPWPDLASTAFPPLVSGVLVLAVAGSFLPGLVGIIAGVLAATLLTAYAILGFAVLHKITSGIGARGLVLTGAYATVGILGWPVLVMMLLGFADTIIDLRGRLAARRRAGRPPSRQT